MQPQNTNSTQKEDEEMSRQSEIEQQGEFISSDDAQEYCMIHGIDASLCAKNPYQIAGAIRDARRDERERVKLAAINLIKQYIEDDLELTMIDNSHLQQLIESI
jgi:hypothetical protein